MEYSDIEKILASKSVHDFTKDIIRRGLTKNCIDAYYDVLLAAETLKIRMDHILPLIRFYTGQRKV